MSFSDRWSRLDELLDGALEQPEERRAEWLERATKGDEELRCEVERLLALALSDDDRLSASGALEGPLWHDVAAYLEGGEDESPLAPGDRLGSYEILELIGTGGMGAVYRARDPNLNRDVAIKALSHSFQKDSSFLRRFEREAKLLATLNHPNIGAIYDLLFVDDQPFLVLELVAGPTLADRLDEGVMELGEVVTIAYQIAEALEEAHGKGIVHRDLKPGNVKLGSGDRVKVLDFGIAKASLPPVVESPSRRREEAGSPPTTAAGMILGTASYMSPEQARGKPVDKRTDIWAFGCILFEMLAGRRPFGGTTTSDVLASVLRDEVPWEWIPASTPASLRRLLGRCLEKEPRQRFQDIGDARIELEELRTGLSGPRRFSDRRAESPGSWAMAPLFLVGLAIGFAVATALFRAPSSRFAPELVTRTSVIIGPEERLWLGISPSLALSPDGSTLAYVAGSGGQSKLFLRRVDSFEASVVRASDGARNPFFSPDGRWIAFFAGGAIRRVPTVGGNPDAVTEAGLQPRGATWTETGEIVFGESGAAGLFVVDETGGEPRQITETASERVAHMWPHAVGNRAVLFTIRESQDGRTRETLAILNLEDGSVRELRTGSQPSYVASGHLVYVQEGTLEATPFDETRLQTTGPSIGMESPINVYPGGAASLAVSRSGAMAYLPPSNVSASLDWIDERGRSSQLHVPRGSPSWPRISPDGTRLAVHVGTPGNRDVWILDLDRPGSSRQLTQGGAEFPVWGPSGRRLAYMTRRHRVSSLYTIAADGSESPRLVIESPITKVPLSWSPQGMLAYYAIHSDTQRDVLVVSVDGETTPETFLDSPANELAPVFSPDGRWLAYVSDETGRNEVYVRPYPPPGGVVMVSIEGGSEPVWSRDGSMLFYRHRDAILAVPVEQAGSELKAGAPEVQLETGLVPNSAGNPLYDALPDGRGFIVMRSPGGASIDRVHFVVGIDKELRRRAPAER